MTIVQKYPDNLPLAPATGSLRPVYRGGGKDEAIDPPPGALRLCVVEEQEIFRTIYRDAFTMDIHINLLDIYTGTGLEEIVNIISVCRPDVVLLGVKRLDQGALDAVNGVLTASSEVGVVVLFSACDSAYMKLLLDRVGERGCGMALFSKLSLEKASQLHRIIISVGEGCVILDPALTAPLFDRRKQPAWLSDLTGRELEILNLVARGYTNQAIADALCIEGRTVRHHINSLYSKLRAESDFHGKHLRVSAARLYLETIGELGSGPLSLPVAGALNNIKKM